MHCIPGGCSGAVIPASVLHLSKGACVFALSVVRVRGAGSEACSCPDSVMSEPSWGCIALQSTRLDQQVLIRLRHHSELIRSLPVSKANKLQALVQRRLALFGFCEYLGEEKPDSVPVSRVTPATHRVRPSRHKHRLHFVSTCYCYAASYSLQDPNY